MLSSVTKHVLLHFIELNNFLCYSNLSGSPGKSITFTFDNTWLSFCDRTDN